MSGVGLLLGTRGPSRGRVATSLAILGLALAALAIRTSTARAEDAGPAPAPAAPPAASRPSRYAPVPPGIDALATSPWEDALADRAIATLSSTVAGDTSRVYADLVLAGPAGTKRAAHALADGLAGAARGDEARLVLLDVLASSPRPEVDRLLAAADGEPLTETRAMAARGLGAGRTGLAVEALGRFARDATPAVRAAALRSLFAIETPAAVATRVALPPDRSPDLHALRLRLHRLRGDRGPDVEARATLAYLGGRSPAVRIEGARLLAASFGEGGPSLATILRLAIDEFATGQDVADYIRDSLGVPAFDYDPGLARLAAAESLVALLERGTLTPLERARLIDVAVGWIARPEREFDAGDPACGPVEVMELEWLPGPIGMYGPRRRTRRTVRWSESGGGRGRVVDDEARALIAAHLPAVGAALVESVVARLIENRFEDPTHGVRLLLSLPLADARDALGRIVLATPPPPSPIVAAAAGGLRDLRRVGGEAVARSLLDRKRPYDVRADALAALALEPAAIALPLLIAALHDADDSIAGRAATVLAERGEPEAHAALESSLLDARWRDFETALLAQIASKPTDANFAFLNRLLTSGPADAREAILDMLKHPQSLLRGSKAIALVERAVRERSLGLKETQIASAYTSVDGPAGVRYIRERWKTSRSPRVMLRNLEVVPDRAALDFALEVAASLPDDSPLLDELVSVLSGAPATDPARTGPFWRRVLVRAPIAIRLHALGRLSATAHGPLADLLVPILADGKEYGDERDTARLRALAACTGEKGQPPWMLLWSIASDRVGDEFLRTEAAKRLGERAEAPVRQRSLAWLNERVDEASDTVELIAGLAARGASAGEAADLLQLFEDELARRYERTPYFRVEACSREERAHRDRESALIAAIAATGDGPSLDTLAATLFDPRFATYSSEARRFAALGRGGGGGPVAAAIDPRAADVLLFQSEEDPNATPVAPVPAETAQIVGALRDAGTAGTARIAKALAAARESGRLAAFSDLYLTWIGIRLAAPGADGAPHAMTPAEDAVIESIEGALARTTPDAGVEELWVREYRAHRAATQGDWASAAEAMAGVVRIAGRTGLADLPPSRWIGRSKTPPLSWLALRAQQDLYEGTALAKAGKSEEARDAFRRGLARAPFEPRILRLSAQLRLATGFDLATAEAEALRAIELERRSAGDAASSDDQALLSQIRARSERK